jgi:hypothetical protein
MKKSMLNVITLALVLINLILTVILTFSLVSTNTRTNNLIKKVAQIIDLDSAGMAANGSQTGTSVNIDDIEYIEVTSGDSSSITVSYPDGGKTHYVVLRVTIGLNKKARDYDAKSTSINNGMKLIVSQITTEALKYSYNDVTKNKTTIENNLLTALQDQFETEAIVSVTLSEILVQ